MKNIIDQTRRLSEIVAVFFVFYWHGFILNRGNFRQAEAKRSLLLRQSLEKLGSVFVKFGQLLSLRPDFLSLAYCRELFYLLEDVPPFAYSEVVRTIHQDFGKSPDKLFKSFETFPIAAASFGQVHAAHLKTGEKVAVKVRRPGIEKRVKEDIVLMKILARFVDLIPLGPNKITPLINEFETWTKEELNYELEADYTEKYYRSNAEDADAILSPKIYRQYCSQRVLTTEFIEGITLGKILLATREKNQKILKGINKIGFSGRVVAETILKDSIKQIFLKGIFHADPHPANIIFTNKGRLVYVDLGNYGEIDRTTRIKELRYLRSLFYKDKENAFEALCALCDVSQVKDMAGLRREHDRIIDETLDSIKNEEGNLSVLGGKKLTATLKLTQKYRVIIPNHMTKYFRMMGILESLIISFYPQIKISDLAGDFRNISIENILEDLPLLIGKDHLEKHLISWINVIEKEITSKSATPV